MTAEVGEQVKDIFGRAVACDPMTRAAFVCENCGDDEELRKEVESLLAADTQTGSLLYDPLLETDRGEVRRADRRSPDGSLEGRLIGPYQIQREIGRGGMGVVYLAASRQ